MENWKSSGEETTFTMEALEDTGGGYRVPVTVSHTAAPDLILRCPKYADCGSIKGDRIGIDPPKLC